MPGALENITVLDLTHVLAGPFCTYQLGLLGADVIKIENPADPDCARGRGPDDAGNAQGLGLTYQVQGGNKRSLALDLSVPEGREILLGMVASADVLVENYTTGALDRLGLGYETLRKVNPRLVHCSMTGFGDTGPKAGHGAYDNTIQATSGTIAQCGGVKPGVSFVDYATGYAAAFAVASALVQVQRDGQGTHISISMLEVALQMMAPEAAAAQYAQTVARGKEVGISSYETAQGTLMLGSFRPAQYRKLAALLSSLGHDMPEVQTISSWSEIWALPGEVKEKLAQILKTDSAASWVAKLQAADIPAEEVQSLSDAVGSPQLAARGYFQPNPDAKDTPLPTAAFQMTQGGPALTTPPPKLGAQSRDILLESGIGADKIDALYRAGIVA